MAEETRTAPAAAPAHGQKMGPKTRWCEICKTRHGVPHEHFKKGDRTADTVTGSKSAADLGEQAGKAKQNLSVSKQIEKLKAEEEEKLREALERRWARRMRWMYSLWARVLDDPKIRLTETEEKDFGEVHADFCLIWGWKASSKIEVSFDVLAMHTTVIASRSKWAQKFLSGLKEEKDNEHVDDKDLRDSIPRD